MPSRSRCPFVFSRESRLQGSAQISVLSPEYAVPIQPLALHIPGNFCPKTNPAISASSLTPLGKPCPIPAFVAAADRGGRFFSAISVLFLCDLCVKSFAFRFSLFAFRFSLFAFLFHPPTPTPCHPEGGALCGPKDLNLNLLQ